MTSEFKKTSFLFGGNAVFVEEIYQQYLSNPISVDKSWQEFFKDYLGSKGNMRPSWGEVPTLLNARVPAPQKGKEIAKSTEDTGGLRAEMLINAYRQRGHYLSMLDPLGIEIPRTKTEVGLEAKDFGVTDANLINKLDSIYARTLAIECSHLQSREEESWLYNKFESRISFTKEQKISILENLIAAGGMENYLHVKFPGAKRFSIEGGDATIASLEYVIASLPSFGANEAVIGMAHRGRLATLTRVMGKPYRTLFAEFMGKSPFSPSLGISGDVKYHMGYNSIRKFDDGEVKLSLLPNPSHLEAVNPVVAGNVRAKQDVAGNTERNASMGIIIHGDAAFCGQGVVAESLAMSYIAPYNVGGIFHVVINNQVGFTANAVDGHPSRYSTEIAKMSGSPILHVNGDDAESVIFATNIALEYWNKFHKDVVLEIICYRKYGHNEGDEPMYTQPQMYDIIKQKQTPADIYAAKLQGEGVLDADAYLAMQAKFKALLDEEFTHASEYKVLDHKFEGLWAGFARNGKEVKTGVKKEILTKLGISLCNIPDSFALNPKLKKLFDQRIEDLKRGEQLDWAAGEQLAFATLLAEGTPIRLTGQDAGRGTFSHRHSVLHDQKNGSRYIPLNNIPGGKASYEVADSNLSEYGVLGFEYGYSLVDPKRLTIWEAQFGDFANGAQIMFDQFISSAETKWMQMSGLVMLLPHAQEGQGPEHSSARLERYLQLCAEDNIQVVMPSTPASFFHMIRRQIHRNFRKPLIVMTPKSLLRHKLAVSTLADMDEGTAFKPVLDDGKTAKKLIFCSGKVYYDLLEFKMKENITDVALIRLEQLYPFPTSEIKDILLKYKQPKDVVWCQEEPRNMGAWTFVKPHLEDVFGNIKYCGRLDASSPAVGYLSVYNVEQARIVKEALSVIPAKAGIQSI